LDALFIILPGGAEAVTHDFEESIAQSLVTAPAKALAIGHEKALSEAFA